MPAGHSIMPSLQVLIVYWHIPWEVDIVAVRALRANTLGEESTMKDTLYKILTLEMKITHILL